MTQIAGKAFSQLTNLNIIDELRIRGVLITPFGASFQVTETAIAYTAVPADDGVAATGTFNVTLFAVAQAAHFITIKSISPGGTVTVVPDGSETIDGSATKVLTAGASVTLMPITGGWAIV